MAGLLTDIGNSLSNLWNQGTNFVQNDIVKPVQQELQQLPQQIPQVAQSISNTVAPIANYVANQPLINNPLPFHMVMPFQSPTVGQVLNFAQNALIQSPLRAAASIKQTPILQNLIPGPNLPQTLTPQGPIGKFLFGNQPIQSLNQQVTQGVNVPFVGNVKGLPAVPLVAGATALNLMPFSSGDNQVAQDAINLAKNSSTVEDFAKSLNSAAPEVQDFIQKTIQDPQTPVNSVEDFFNAANNAKPRGFTTSVQNSNEVSPQTKVGVNASYTPQANQTLIDNSNALIGQGLGRATNQVIGVLGQKGNIADQAVSDAIAVAKANDIQGNFDQATAIYNQLAGKLTEAGRTVQAASLLSNRTPAGLLYSSVATLKKAGVEMTPELNNTLQSLVDGVKQGSDPLAVQKLIQFVNSNIPRSKVSAAMGIWRAGLLTGPETVAKVAVSHGITTPFEMAAQIPAELADRMMSLVTGKRSLTATAQGFGKGLGEGLQAAGTKLTTGLDVPNSGGFESDFGSATKQTPYENLVQNVHGSLPKPAYMARFNVSLNDQALTEATNQGLAGAEKDAFVQDFVKNPPQSAVEIAHNDAAYATNQQTTSAGKLASTLQNFSPGGIPVGKFLVPFTRIPSAIGVNGLVNYSPFGIPAEVISQIRQGAFDQRTMAQAIGRSATGTTIAALGALLGENGLMTLKAPSDPKERALWEAQGKQPNSIKLGNTWVSLNAFGPVGLVLGMGGAFGQAMKQTGNNVGASISTALAGGGRLLLDQPYLKGISGVANALNDPTRYGETFFNNTIGSVIPAISSQIARGSDTVQRMFPSGVPQQFMSEIPGLRQQLPIQRDLYGRPVSGANPSGTIPGGILGTINPFYPSQAKSDIVSSELQRLYNTLGSSGAPNIAQPTANQTIYGQKVKLTNQQISNFIAQEGPKVQQALTQLISSPFYQKLTDAQKSQVITTAIDQSKNSDQLLTQTLQGQVPLVNASGIQTGSVTLNKYQLQAAKDAFSNSGNNFQDLGSIVLRKDAAGNITAMTKDAFNTSLYEKQMAQDKLNNDVGSWMAHAKTLAALYQSQMQNANTDQLDRITLMNKYQTLVNEATKYQNQQAFLRGTTHKVTVPQITGKLPPLVLPKMNIGKINTSFKSPASSIAKFGNMKIVNSKTPSIHTASIKSPAKFKITNPRVYLSTMGSSQRGVRKQAGISVPVRKRKLPVLHI